MKRRKWLVWGVLCLVLCVLFACKKDVVLLEHNHASNKEISEENSYVFSEEGQQTDALDAQDTKIYVHVCGAVETPGVYALSADSRVYEAVELAGGFDSEADVDAVNLVETIKDGQQIRIPFIGEEQPEASDKLININQADVETLCQIPGIGESRAQAIIEYRTEHGGFQSIEELMNVTGIKDGIYAKISPYIECR